MLDYKNWSIADLKRHTKDLEKANCEDSLAVFVRRAWHVIEGGQPYVHGWHIDFICDHLEAITNGEVLDDGTYYNRLLANVPPGTMKSLLVSVFWPAWEWGPRNMPHLRYVCASHSQDLAIRDNLRMRRLIVSDWYQGHWGDRVKLSDDQNMKTKFENTAGGFRQASAAGSITGSRGDRVIIDDPHSVESAASDQMRKTTLDWFLEAVPTRLNNPDKSAIVVIMQRLHEEDVSGAILEKGLGYDHIMLPMKYDSSRAAPTMLGYLDPREEDGELLFPERFPLHVVERDEATMGMYAAAGQFQQEPRPRGGSIILRDYWQLWPHEKYPDMEFILASLDTAYGEKEHEGDFHALTIWGVWRDGGEATGLQTQKLVDGKPKLMRISKEAEDADIPKIMLMYAMQGRWPFHELQNKLVEQLRKWKVDRLVIEKSTTSVPLQQELQRVHSYEDWGIQLLPTKGKDKIARTYAVQHIFEEGIVFAPNTAWAEMVISQSEFFPKGKHDDLHDTVTQAMNWLRGAGLIQRGVERSAELADKRQFRGNTGAAPLYPV